MRRQACFYVAEYVRLSREDGDKAESDSIGNQKKLIEGYLKSKEEFTVYDIYVDDGFSGTNFKRPSFQRMIRDVETGRVNCVIVKDLSRFGRDYIETGKYLERYFPDKGVRFISITDNIDSAQRAYDILLPIKNIFNEQYARDISDKIHASLRAKQEAGEFIGAFASYGYQKASGDKNRLVVDDYAAAVVRRIFELYLKGCGKQSIADILNGEGIVCPSEYKRLGGANYRNSNRLENTSYWTYSTVNRILHNEMYAGNMVQGKKSQRMRGKARVNGCDEWIVVEGTHDAIVTAEIWEKTQELLQRRTRQPDFRTHANIFAGLVKCGDCGRAMVKKDNDYYCGTYVRCGKRYCTPHKVSGDVFEAVVRADLRVILENTNDLEQLVTEQGARGSERRKDEFERQRIEAERKKLQKRKKELYEDYKENLISREEFAAYRQDYVKKETLLFMQMKAVQEREMADETEVFRIPWIRRLLETKDVERLDRETVIEMIREIRIYEDRRIVICYKFSGESGEAFDKFYEEKEGKKEIEDTDCGGSGGAQGSGSAGDTV